METLFDLGQSGYRDWPLPVIGVVFVAIAPIWFFVPEDLTNLPLGATKLDRKRAFWLFVLLGSAWSTISFFSTFVAYYADRDALESGRYETVQGLVSDFEPGSAQRPARDQTFTVAGKRFEIELGSGPGFRGFGSDEAPQLRDPTGRELRISYLDQKPPMILRVETSK